MDFVKELGALTLDHRFKRLMQRLLDEAEAIYRALELPVRPRWASTLLLLHRHAPLSVTEIARRLRLSHPAVVQLLRELDEAGIAAVARDEADGRRRRVSLTPAGRRLMPKLGEVWKELEEAQLRAFREVGWDVLPLLERAEERLRPGALASEVIARLGDRKAQS